MEKRLLKTLHSKNTVKTKTSKKLLDFLKSEKRLAHIFESYVLTKRQLAHKRAKDVLNGIKKETFPGPFREDDTICTLSFLLISSERVVFF